MINPSANGWIDKFFLENKTNFIDYNHQYDSFYFDIRKSGFVYGHTLTLNLKEPFSLEGLSSDEVTKLALLNALYSIYRIAKKEPTKEAFLKTVEQFYNTIVLDNYAFLKAFLPSGSTTSKLESIFANRIQTNNNFFSKSFSHILTNALLFIDVLAFNSFLENNTLSPKYLKDLELTCIKIITLAFHIKTNKSKYDVHLVKLFENSIRYTKFASIEHPTLNNINFEHFKYDIEKLYLLDITEMAIWSDATLEHTELEFLNDIIRKTKLSDDKLHESLSTINWFISNYKDEIPYFNYSHPVKHFYDQTNRTVTKLITRNKKRLTKEIKESKELMYLLAKSTNKELSAEEKKKVKKQLLDICKTIPSLTIFLLPGGGILLPILIKYIPQLLPSAFNENLDD
jgi:hypothetical protein